MDGLPGNLELIYMSPLQARQKTTLPLALKLWYNPSGADRSCSTPLHRTVTPLPLTTSSRRKPCNPAMRPPASKLLGAPGSRLRRWASGICFVAQPNNLTVFWWTAANPVCKLQSWAATLHRLRMTTLSCFSRHHAARTWPRWPPSPSSQTYLSLHSLEAPQGIDLSCHSSPAPTQIKPHPAPAILGQESVHTTLSITHHSQERPSTGPRMLRSSITPLMRHWQHTRVTNSEKRKKNKKRKKNSNKWSKAKQKPRKDHLSEKILSPLR
jgi:hypothetical protein